MVVTQGGRAGRLVKLPFRVERTAAGAPLRVLISNDAAAGASDTAQSSVWMAAMAAVMNRNDVLSGVRITMEYSDFMDGPSAGAAGQLMKSLPADGLSDAEFHRAVQLVLGARTFARGSAHLLKFGIDVGRWENGAFVCKDANFLGFLVRRARETALTAIADCRKAGVFCPAAILDFQLADGYDVTSGGSDCVIHDVLERYWSAGLTAKALRLGFKASETNLAH